MGSLRHCPFRRFGIVLFGALAANLAHTIVLCRLGRSFGYALASFLLIAANLAIFFVWTFLTNQATNNWTVVPNNWNKLHIQSEFKPPQSTPSWPSFYLKCFNAK